MQGCVGFRVGGFRIRDYLKLKSGLFKVMWALGVGA